MRLRRAPPYFSPIFRDCAPRSGAFGCANPQRQPYPSDLSDAEGKVLEPFLPKPKEFGHPRTVELREIINAIFYVQRSGCQWEMLPHDFPPHTTVG
jgi:hypothetical protein